MIITEFISDLMEHIESLGVSPKINFDDTPLELPQLIVDAPLAGSYSHHKTGTGTDWHINIQFSYYDTKKLDTVQFSDEIRKHILDWDYLTSLEKRCTNFHTRYWDKIKSWECLIIFEFRFFDLEFT